MTPSPYEVIDPITGFVKACRSIPLDPGSPSVFAVTALMSDTTPYLGVRGDVYNSGAGLTEQTAWDAGVGEAIERYCLAVVQPARMTLGSWSGLPASANALHPSEVALLDVSALDSYPREAFSEQVVLAWLPGQSLVDGRGRLVPACLVHIPYPPSFPEEALIAPAISTGSACGPTLEDATLSGLYESIERDAVSIMWLNRLAVPRLVVDEEELQRLFAERFERPNLEYYLFVIALDVWAPTVICLVRDVNFDPPMFCIGGACRADIRDAVVKALIEGVQGWYWARYHRLRHGHLPVPDFREIHSFESRVKLYACSDMAPALRFLLETEASVRLSDFPRVKRSPEQLIASLSQSVAATGSDVVVVDLTTPDVVELRQRVVKVFCPGFQQLEGDHRFRLLDGSRWREVPVQLGYRSAPVDTADLNPYPHPYA